MLNLGIQNFSDCSKGKRLRLEYSSLEDWTPHRATEHHLPYKITQCYLPPDTGAMEIFLNSALNAWGVGKICIFNRKLVISWKQ